MTGQLHDGPGHDQLCGDIDDRTCDPLTVTPDRGRRRVTTPFDNGKAYGASASYEAFQADCRPRGPQKQERLGAHAAIVAANRRPHATFVTSLWALM